MAWNTLSAKTVWADQLPVEAPTVPKFERTGDSDALTQAQVGTAITVVASYTDLRARRKA